MKTFFVLLLTVLTTASAIYADQPHLILHFDVNKTLIASDKAGNKSVEDVINEILASKFKACWDDSITEPISFENYVKKHLLPGDALDSELRSRRSTLLQNFIKYLCDNNHPLSIEAVRLGETVFQILQNGQGDIFPSFYRLLEDLDRKEISYTVVLRSFGDEVFDVAHEIESFSGISFTKFGEMHQGMLHIQDNEYESPHAIYEVLSDRGNSAIRDDWNFWMEGKLKGKYGKPFYIDSEDTTILSIFFDDNINLTNSDYNIVAPMDSKTGAEISVVELAEFGQLVRVNTLEVILDDLYFVNSVEDALEKRKLLQLN